MTLGDVAKHLGCTISFVSDVEHGRRNAFEARQIIQLGELFRIDPGPLLAEAAKSRGSVKISSRREDVLEMAAGLARMLADDDTDNLAAVRNFLKAHGWKPG